jgi:hypothetical protein
LVACIGVALALTAWMYVAPEHRRGALGVALVALGLIAARAPSYAAEFRNFNTESRQASSRFSGIESILKSGAVAPYAARCRPVLSPTHEAVPVIRYQLDLAKHEVVASTQLSAAATRGLQLLQTGYLDPVGLTSIARTQRKPWTTFPLRGFAYRAENDAWIVYAKC